MPSFSVSCRNNPVAGIMPLIPPTELSPHFRRSIARGLCPRPPSRCPSYRGALHLSRSCRRLQHLLVSGGDPGAAPRHRCGERASVQGGSGMTALAPHLSAFLREHLPRERNASPHTVATYAHAFALLVRFAAQRLKRRPSDLTIEDINPIWCSPSSTTSKVSAATSLVPAMRGSRQFAPSSDIWSIGRRSISNRRCASGRCR